MWKRGADNPECPPPRKRATLDHTYAGASAEGLSTAIPTDVAAGSVVDDAKASTSMQPTCSSSLPRNEKATTSISTPHMNDRERAAKYILNYR